MSGQMKTMIDRANSLYSSDYSFRDVYLLSAAAENGSGYKPLDKDEVTAIFRASRRKDQAFGTC